MEIGQKRVSPRVGAIGTGGTSGCVEGTGLRKEGLKDAFGRNALGKRNAPIVEATACNHTEKNGRKNVHLGSEILEVIAINHTGDLGGDRCDSAPSPLTERALKTNTYRPSGYGCLPPITQGGDWYALAYIEKG